MYSMSDDLFLHKLQAVRYVLYPLCVCALQVEIRCVNYRHLWQERHSSKLQQRITNRVLSGIRWSENIQFFTSHFHN